VATDVRAFSAEHVHRLTGLSHGQLRYWDKTGFFNPTFADEERHSPHSRVYSFRDLVGLRTIAILRNQHHKPLQTLRKVGQLLKHYHETPWSSIVIFVAGKEVFFQEPSSDVIRDAVGGQQQAIRIDLKSVGEDLRAAANKLRDRTPDEYGTVERKRYLLHNQWVMKGTRIPTSAILEYAQAGYDTQAIIKEFPRLTEKDIEVALRHEQQLQLRAPRKKRRASA
jgi:uncharacterized protein (DUF433 family)